MSVGAVVDYDDVLKVLAYQSDHLFLAVVEHQIVIACIPVVALVEGIVIGCCSVGCSVLIGAVNDALYVSGKVCALSAGTGDHDHCGVRECLRIRHHVGRIGADIGLGQCPVLCPHAADRTVRLVSGVEITELCVGLNACVIQTLQKADRLISLIQSAGSAAAQHGICGSPAEYVELGTLSHRKNAFVLQKHRAFLSDLNGQCRSFFGGLFGNRTASADQVEHRAHGAGAYHIHAYADACDRSDKCRASDETLSGFCHLADSDLDNDRSENDDADRDQVGLDRCDDVHNVTHVNR